MLGCKLYVVASYHFTQDVYQMIRSLFAYLLIILTSFCTGSVYAAEQQPANSIWFHTQAKPFQGVYGGLGVGGLINLFNTNTTTTLSFPSSAFFANSQNNAVNAGANVFGNLFVGYLFPISIFYLGPEIYLNVGNSTFSTTQVASATLPTETLSTTTSGHLRNYEIGIDLRLGVSVTPTTLLYGLVGAAFNNMTVNSSSTIARPLLPLSTSVNASASQAVTGLRLGAGIEQKILANLNLRVSYAYTSFPSKNISNSTAASSQDPFFELGPISNSTSTRFTNHSIWAAVVYQFDNSPGYKS
jgi:opacity protein-like surface antigen